MAEYEFESKRKVRDYILEIYSIAHRIAPINKTGTNSINEHWKEIYRMINLANAITRNFHSACHEIELLESKLDELIQQDKSRAMKQ